MEKSKLIELKKQYKPFVQHPPEVCLSCMNLTDDQVCREFKAKVPDEQLDKENECPGYVPEVPF